MSLGTILVTGATGKQGGSVISALLAEKAEYKILALTRDASSPSAKNLAAKSSGITLVEGNLDDADTVFENAKKLASSPIWGVFSVQTLTPNKAGPINEERQGKALIDASVANGVKFFVYSSVDRGGEARSSDNPTNVPHFASKHNIERHLMDQSQMSWTILRPVAFMENFNGGLIGRIFASCWQTALPSRPLQLIATSDIGVFAAKAFMDPDSDRFKGKAISLAGDELTFEQMSAVFKEKTGSDVPLSWGFMARVTFYMSEEMSTMFNFFEKEGYGADIQELRKIHPGLKTLGAWLPESPYAK
ncbi:NmrA-like family [Geosmithia morbida]|uniref:NmrA-like family n=1 Tax=Geosmithia morbida TaxID=1094350 RepID=A0A9P4YSS8_9HYPO|nr:NmrA-like family [Geosmithia morbida]KAF4122453.1 NmrA-like family [Geosmithia morbida]